MTWELILLAMTAVAVGCLLPAAWQPPHLPNDKLLHFGAYAALRLLLAAGWRIEVLRNFVPGRKFCWRDMTANAAGIAAAACCAPLLLHPL